MPWPTMADYQEAIQHPRLCFADPELQQGSPLLNSLGLPKPITGAFASVYQLACGRKHYAVRCFLRYHPDQEQRYAAISQTLRRAELPFMVHFTLLQQGIRVRGQWYPILKMEWIDGLPLHTYIERHLKQPARFNSLAARFEQVMARLSQAGIAHGDLQHGNLLIVNHDIRLIDYDGMYVPSLRGMRSHELGHRNYQHPRRGEDDFGPTIDHFSAWTIYTSLKALSVQPRLWRELEAGDESLLLRHDDYLRPQASAALRRLADVPDAEVRSLAQTVRTAAAADLRQVPPLGGRLVEGSALRTVAGWLTLRPARASGPGEQPTQVARAASEGASYQGADWVLDYIRPTAESSAVEETAPPVAERYVISGCCALGYLTWFPFGPLAPLASLLLTLGGMGLVLGYLALQYARFPEVRAKRRLAWERMLRRSELAVLRRRAQWFAGERQRLADEEAERLSTLDHAIEDAITQELARVTLDWRDVPSLNPRLGLRLRWLGIRTAAEVTEPRLVRVSGLRQPQIDELLAWRAGIEQEVRATHSHAIQRWHNSRLAAVHREYDQKQRQLEADEARHAQLLAAKRAELERLAEGLRQYAHVTFTTYLEWVF